MNVNGRAWHGLPIDAFDTNRIDAMLRDCQDKTVTSDLRYGDLKDRANIIRIAHEAQPDEMDGNATLEP